MNIGDMKHRLTILNPTYAENSLGERVPTFAPAATVWADVCDTAGMWESLRARAMSVNASHRIIIRPTNLISQTSRLSYRNARGQTVLLEVVSVGNQERGGGIEIMAVSRG